ncbi:hypothetical protein IU436_16580 [Nocardia farcinica]|uniref:hypothetical protein n=1 Tax=Nocardia farcinica TaxID=37329 RepID=UPI001893EC7B|nr:hypothetical protein [Nocardia farcinica]MBF6231826.1 hypothetical protein [Nocardia farcinica]MBF6260171.1 hypothetical protein [Nocardia farcinica]MBF6420732.1 hypothetical protein [Nocardia farcinica]MBF6431976.1 hypothetical protein [Nocardia farcinica]MBF6502686.1 hypothetical protein [Nocardia farcinica]
MSDLDLDPPKTREMADTIKRHGDAVRASNPLAVGNLAAPTLEGAEIGGVIDATASALERVVIYHAQRLQEFSDLTNKAVEEFLLLEGNRAKQFEEMGPR